MCQIELDENRMCYLFCEIVLGLRLALRNKIDDVFQSLSKSCEKMLPFASQLLYTYVLRLRRMYVVE